VKLEVQSTLTKNGGFIAGGFDTLSSVVNNSPDHNQSLIKLRTIGFAVGAKNADESIHMLRLSKVISTDFSASIGGGYGRFFTSATAALEDNKVLDATAKYTISPNLSINGNYGRFFGDFKDHAGSLSLKAIF